MVRRRDIRLMRYDEDPLTAVDGADWIDLTDLIPLPRRSPESLSP